MHMNILVAFTMSLTGLLMYRFHLMSALLCLEGMMLSLSALTILNSHFTLASMMPILLLFAAWEAAIGLTLLVLISNTSSSDYVQNHYLQC